MARLVVSENGRYLKREGGDPFLYVGDTAWELFHRLSRDEATRYLEDRATKGFTVIQAVVLSELDGLTVPNANGDLPLLDRDPETPNEAYFAHVDWIVEKANELGLVVGMLPTWGRYWKEAALSESDPGAGTEFQIFSPENARAYATWLARRYAESDLIWILGGDHDINTDRERQIINGFAEGLRAGDSGAHLITFHPRGPGRSREQLDGVDWIDFHMEQSSHAATTHDPGIFIDADYSMQPPRPVLDGEPRYEHIPVGFYLRPSNPSIRCSDYDSRTAAWQSILAGACGHTYGNNNVWQMWDSGRDPIINASVPWHTAINHPGAAQMGYLRTLLEDVGWWNLLPAAHAGRTATEGITESFLVDGPAWGPARIRASLAADGRVALIYSPKGEPFTLRLTALSGPRVRESWFDPRYGTRNEFHVGAVRAFQTYTPPSSGDERDWLLVLECE